VNLCQHRLPLHPRDDRRPVADVRRDTAPRRPQRNVGGRVATDSTSGCVAGRGRSASATRLLDRQPTQRTEERRYRDGAPRDAGPRRPPHRGDRDQRRDLSDSCRRDSVEAYSPSRRGKF